jgi:hypothetical protein
MRLDADDLVAFCGAPPVRLLSQVNTSRGPAFGNALGPRSVIAIWQLFVVLTEQLFEFLGGLGRIAFHIPQLSINVVAKFPGIL